MSIRQDIIETMAEDAREQEQARLEVLSDDELEIEWNRHVRLWNKRNGF